MIFFIDPSVKSKERFDLSKFMEFTNGDYDPLTSYLLNRIHELPISAKIKTLGHENLPDLLSYDIYDTEQYWELLLFYNRKLGFDDLKDNEEIKIFDLEQLEETFMSLRSRQQALNKKDNGIITILSTQGGSSEIMISETEPVDKTVIWKKPNSNNLFVYDQARALWLSTTLNELLVAIGFNNVTNQYLFQSNGQNMDLVPFIAPKNICLCTMIIQSQEISSFGVIVQNFSSSNTLLQVNITNDIVKIDNSIKLVLNELDEIKLFLAGTNISNPKISVFYREIG